jgi:hypothetical protein
MSHRCEGSNRIMDIQWRTEKGYAPESNEKKKKIKRKK